jgi:hypothetical protein
MRLVRLGRRRFESAYSEFELSLFGERRAYAAIAPLVGLTLAVRSSSAGAYASVLLRRAS